MTARFVSNLGLLVLGLLLVAAAPSFGARTLSWLQLGAGCLVLAMLLAAFAVRGRGIVQRLLDVVTLAAGVWAVVSSHAFSAAQERPLAFADGWLFAGLGLAGLVLWQVAVSIALEQPAAGAAVADAQEARFSRTQRVPAR